jgi:hypothetical protein
VEISLRLGVFRDRIVFEEMLQHPTAIVVPAHIAAYARDGLWGFLRGIGQSRAVQEPPYFYDPMSYWLDIPPEFWSKGSEARRGQPLALPIEDLDRIRPAFVALLEAYGMAMAVQESATGAELRRRFVAEGVSNCLDFQRQGSEPKGKKTVDKYAAILGQTLQSSGMRPQRLVAPYFAVRDLDPRSVADQAALNASALTNRKDGEAMWSVVALDSPARVGPIGATSRDALRLDEFDGVGLWVSDLDEHDARADTLTRYRELIRSVARPVWVMYGGYFAILLGNDGVANVSHGIYYTESKKMRGPVGSGPAPERYYIPGLHRFYLPGSAFRFLEMVPEMQCDCPDCSSGLSDLVRQSAAASSSPAARMAWIRRLQRHFLYCRAAEVEAASSRPTSELVAELRESAATVGSVGRPRLSALGISPLHLLTWAQVLA